MAVIHRSSSSSNDKTGAHDAEKAVSVPSSDHDAPIRGVETASETQLHRGLMPRHITMIAIGGAIGTGLIVGTGKALAQAGPGSVFIAYTFIGLIVYLVMGALGEMATWLPMASGFTGYASRFCDPSLGFALGWTYYLKYIIVTPNQLTAGALIIQYWVPRDRVNPGVFITIFYLLIICINYFGIKFFGEFEFWLSSFKVVTIVGIILMTLCFALMVNPQGYRPGFYTWQNPGAFKPYIVDGPTGQFYGFWSTIVTATFAYLGTELVGVTVAEAQNPRKTIPKAIRLTFYRILFFYCLSALLLGMVVPYNSEELAFANKSTISSAAASPFVVAIKLNGIQGLDHVVNACILIFVFSASNSDLYIASRTLYGLASDGSAPAIFRRTDKRGVPIYALGVSALFALLAYMNVSDDSRTVFGYFVNLTTIFGLLSWISILTAHIWFVRARMAQGLTNDKMKYTAPLGIWGSYFALFMCILIAFTKNFDVFTGEGLRTKYATFITAYIGIPVYLILIFGHKIITKSKGIRPHEADFYTGKDFIDREEEAYLAAKAAYDAENPDKAGKFYNRFVAWLF